MVNNDLPGHVRLVISLVACESCDALHTASEMMRTNSIGTCVAATGTFLLNVWLMLFQPHIIIKYIKIIVFKSTIRY